MIDSYNIIDVDENILNHYHLTIPAASTSLLQRSDPVVFTADSVVAKLRVFGFTSGSGQVDVYGANNSTIFTAAINRDTTITDTIRSVLPKRVIIVFNRFSGGFEFRMD